MAGSGTWSNAHEATAPGKGAAGASVAHEDPSLWGPRLGRILDKQLALYRQLAALSERQQGLIQDEQTDGLMAVLADRQRVIDQISDVNAEVEPFAQNWGALVPKLDEPLRAALGAKLAELDSLVAEINTRDEQDRKVLESRRSEASEALDDVSRRRAAVGAYGGRSAGQVRSAHVTPRYQDRKG